MPQDFVMYKNKKVDNTLDENFMTSYLKNAQIAEFKELSKIIKELYTLKKKPLVVLDVGVGDGRIIRKFVENGLWDKIELFVGFDNSQIEIDKSNKLVNDLQIKDKAQIVYFDANNLDKPDSNEIFKHKYDLILCTYFTPGNFKPDKIEMKMGRNGLIFPYDVKSLEPNKKFIKIFKSAYSLLEFDGKLVLGSTYIDSDENRLRQEEFYKKCGMTIITSKNDPFTATKEGFWSQRFSRERIYKYFSWVNKDRISFILLDNYSFAEMVAISK